MATIHAREWMMRKWAWVKLNPLFWANVALVFGTAAVTCIWPAPTIDGLASDLRIRSWGLGLQLLGVVTVWLDLTSTAREMGQHGDGFFRGTMAWLRAGLFGNLPVLGVGTAEMAAITGKARAKVRHSLKADIALDARVASIEAYLAQVDADLDAAFKEIDALERALSAQVKQEADERGRAIDKLRESLREAVAGNYAILAFGAVWLAVGLVLATLAPEIAKIVAGQWLLVWRAL